MARFPAKTSDYAPQYERPLRIFHTVAVPAELLSLEALPGSETEHRPDILSLMLVLAPPKVKIINALEYPGLIAIVVRIVILRCGPSIIG